MKSFDGDTERKLGENKKKPEWLVEQLPKLRKIEGYRNCVPNQPKDTLQLYKMSEKCESFYREAEKEQEELGSENLDESRKQALSSKLDQLVTKLGSFHAGLIQIMKSNFATDWLMI